MSSEPPQKPFDVDQVMRRVREAARPYPKPALFALADQGFKTPFEQLVACIISIRTRDEVTEPVAAELFRHARTPAEMSRLAPEEIDRWIRRSTYHQAKAPQILAIARRILHDYGGELPCDDDVLRSFEGVGPKCANLVLAIACGRPRIAVDTHVHRVALRLGWIPPGTTAETAHRVLGPAVPPGIRYDLHVALIEHGRTVCKAQRPRCGACVLRDECAHGRETAGAERAGR